MLVACASVPVPSSDLASTTPPGLSPIQTPRATEATRSGSPEPTPAFGESVTFQTADDVSLHGLLLGSGRAAIILAHQVYSSADSWLAIAPRLADAGFQVLAIDFRGNGRSAFGPGGSPNYRVDLAAAEEFVRSRGAESVILIGASMGGIASLEAAATTVRAAAVITLSAPRTFGNMEVSDEDLAAIEAPLLLMNSREDPYAADTREMAAAAEEATLEMYPGNLHGILLLTGEDGQQRMDRILRFLRGVT